MVMGPSHFTGDNEGFVNNLYFSAITQSSVGYGDISPVTPTARIINAIHSILSLILTFI